MRVFVYGANAQGIHGAGSAKEALKHGAVAGKVGRQGASYGIVTKFTPWSKMLLFRVEYFVCKFLEHAEENPQDEFDVVEIGCGLAGFTPEQIGPLFRGAPSNVHLPQSFRDVIAARTTE